MIFDDEVENEWNRERVLERLAQVNLPPGVMPQMGTDWSPVGQIYFFTLKSTNPSYDLMELKSIEDWTVEKKFKSVPDVVDVASFGGPTREYQVRVDPNKLVAYGFSLWQVEQQLPTIMPMQAAALSRAVCNRSMSGKWASSEMCATSKTLCS